MTRVDVGLEYRLKRIDEIKNCLFEEKKTMIWWTKSIKRHVRL